MPPKPVGRPKTVEDLVRVYDYIYQNPGVSGPKGPLGDYGSHDNRDPQFQAWISENVPKGSSVLDASCGRAHLALWLRVNGYTVTCTEVSQWLVEKLRTEHDLDVTCLTYDRLLELGEESVDCVCSQDVLEHMLDEERALEAIANLCAVSRRYVCVSVGLKSNVRNYTTALQIPGKPGVPVNPNRKRDPRALDLHLVVKPGEWWHDALAEHLEIDYKEVGKSTAWFFGKKRS